MSFAHQAGASDTSTSKFFAIVTLGILVSFASIQKYWDIYQGEGPPLVFPLETIAKRGRETSVVLLGLVTLLALILPGSVRFEKLPLTCQALIGVQAVMLLKLLSAGIYEFAAIAGVVYISTWVVYSVGLPKLLGTGTEVVDRVAEVLMGGLFIFISLNIYQYTSNPVAATMSQGQFHGITANPQMVALCIGTGFPSAIYMLINPKSNGLTKLVTLFVILCAVYLIYLSGSRLAVLLAIVGSIPFLPPGLAMSGIIAIFLGWLLNDEITALLSSDEKIKMLIRTNDSRSVVWQGQWNTFLEYPFFGKPIEGDRLRFGESSWLALIAATGIFGFIPAATFLFSIIGCAMNVWKVRHSRLADNALLKSRYLVGSITVLVVGSFFEAYMLGTLTMPLTTAIILIYGATTYNEAIQNVTSLAMKNHQAGTVTMRYGSMSQE